MNTNIYFIIGGIAVAFLIYYLIMMNYMKKRKQKQLDDFSTRHDNTPLSEEQKRELVFGAILAYYRGESILDIIPKTNLDKYVYGLKRQWEINDHATAVETLDDLLALERSTQFDNFLDQGHPDLDKIKKSVAKSLGIDLQEVLNVHSTYAWDTCRLTSLAKWCYWANHISQDEMWNYIHQSAQKASQKGRDWREYTISFLLGRTIQGFDLDDLNIETKQLFHSKNALIGKYPDIDCYQRFPFKEPVAA